MISPVLAEFSQGMDESTHPSVWPLNEDPLVIEAFDKGIQSIIIGEKTPEQVAQDVQTVKDRQIAREINRMNPKAKAAAAFQGQFSEFSFCPSCFFYFLYFLYLSFLKHDFSLLPGMEGDRPDAFYRVAELSGINDR